MAVLVLEHRLGYLFEVLLGDPALAVGDSFKTGYLESLTLLEDLHIYGCLGEGVVGAGVEPCEASRQDADLELAVAQEFLIDGGDLQFPPGGWLYVRGHVHDLVGVEVEADDGIVALGMLRLLLDGEAVALVIEFGHAVAFRVVDPVAEDGGLSVLLGIMDRIPEDSRESGSVEDVVAEDETGGVIADEFAADDEGLRQAVGGGLLGVFEAHAEVGAVAEEAAESGEVVGGGDDEDIPDSGLHEGGDGIVDHRFVEDGEQLFAHPLRDGVETGAGTSGENDAFHGICKEGGRLKPLHSKEGEVGFIGESGKGEGQWLC